MRWTIKPSGFALTFAAVFTRPWSSRPEEFMLWVAGIIIFGIAFALFYELHMTRMGK